MTINKTLQCEKPINLNYSLSRRLLVRLVVVLCCALNWISNNNNNIAF